MVKKSEINKKGRLAKSTLSVVLAASMVLTSSSFVWAAPVEDITVVEEGDAALEAVEAPAEEAVGASVDEASVEENVGEVKTTATFSTDTFTLETNTFDMDKAATVQSNIWDAFQATIVKRNLNGFEANENKSVANYVVDSCYTVSVKNNTTGSISVLTGKTDAKTALPTEIGTYTLTIEGNNREVNEWLATGTTTATYTIQDVAIDAAATFKNAYYYTGSAIEPEFDITITKTLADGTKRTVALEKDKDYKIVGCYENINWCTEKDKKAYVEVEYLKGYSTRANDKFYFAINKAELNATNTKISLKSENLPYNGDVQVPEVTVQFKPADSASYITLTEGKDYKLVADIAKEVETGYDVKISPINNFKFAQGTNSLGDTFNIVKQDFNATNLTVEVAEIPFTGDKAYAVNKYLVVKDASSGAVIPSKDYEILYDQGKGVYKLDTPLKTDKEGTFGIKVVAKGNSTNYNYGEITTSYKVVDLQGSLQEYIAKHPATFYNDANSAQSVYTFDTKGVRPNYVEIEGAKFYADGKVEGGTEESTYFTVDFPEKKDCNKVGSYDVKLTGVKGKKYEGQEVTLRFIIIEKNAVNGNGAIDTTAGFAVTEGPAVYKTSSKDIASVFVLKDGDYTLLSGVDYDLVVNSVPGAKYEMTVTFKGNYAGTYTNSTLTVDETKALDLNASNIKAEVKGEYVFAGKAIEPAAGNIVLTEVNGDKSIELRQGYDYVIKSYGANNKVGKGTIVVSAEAVDENGKDLLPNSFYGGTRTIEFDILASSEAQNGYILDTTNLKKVYDYGTNFNPVNDIKVKTTDGKVLGLNADYEVKYYRNGKLTTDYKSAGTVTMEITVKATDVKLSASYRVATALDDAATIPASFADEKYTGSAIEPAVTLKKKNTTVELVKDKDYTVTYTSNVTPGTAYVTIEGIGDYYGTYTRTFKIVGQMEQDIVVLPAQERDLKNRTLKSKATKVKYIVEPKTETTYTSSNPEIVKVDAKTGAIEYTGVGTAKITISAAESEIYKATTKELTVKVLPATPASVKVTSTAKKKISVKAGAVKEAAKYQIRIQKLGCKSTYVNVDNKGALSKVYTTKSAGKFNVWVRSYKTIDGVHHFSAWSPVKTVTVK